MINQNTILLSISALILCWPHDSNIHTSIPLPSVTHSANFNSTINVESINSQPIWYEDENGFRDTIQDKSVVVVFSDLNCAACFGYVSEIFQTLNMEQLQHVYFYFDSRLIPLYARYSEVASMQRRLPSVAFTPAFLPENAIQSLHERFEVGTSSQSPFIFLINDQKTTFIHNNELKQTKKMSSRIKRALRS